MLAQSTAKQSCMVTLQGCVWPHTEGTLVTHVLIIQTNVLIYGNGRACLADFGLSTIILEFNGTSYFTESIRGSIRWAAAELFEAPEDDDEEEDASVSLGVECDIYSFGSIMLQVRDLNPILQSPCSQMF